MPVPAVTLISSLPPHISPDEHRTLTASTPASFAEIPPVLRHAEENVAVSFDPPVDGLSPEATAKGTLYVIESALVFISAAGPGFQIEYPAITLHAISRADAGPSIYCQLDESVEGDAAAADEDASDMRELSIVPQNPASLEPIFEALSLCASLHPDPNLSDDDDMGADDAFLDASAFEVFTGTEGEELSEVGRVRSDFANDNRFAPY
ncbi:hypothetical protein FA95DRAFT_1490055 [Auriscalpium vulgare]|uniref:Uncharacterized protein n=1 Tax=Auriscalpium vulgare TaxID=40419 RepID=A0ACB8RXF6_9AGAM|nr:hypothetical protein FA95DRAFT_1490055 [Auriscalpium vulgare]